MPNIRHSVDLCEFLALVLICIENMRVFLNSSGRRHIDMYFLAVFLFMHVFVYSTHCAFA